VCRSSTKGRKICASTWVRTRAKTSSAVPIHHCATQEFCENHTRILFGMAPRLLKDRGPSIFFVRLTCGSYLSATGEEGRVLNPRIFPPKLSAALAEQQMRRIMTVPMRANLDLCARGKCDSVVVLPWLQFGCKVFCSEDCWIRRELKLFLTAVGTSGLGYPLMLRQDSRSYP